MADKSHRLADLQAEVTRLADLLIVGLLTAEMRALRALQAALPADGSRQPAPRDAEPPTPQTLDNSADGRGDEPVDVRPSSTVRFGLDGRQYEIDLREDQAAELRGAVQRYVDAARVIRPPRRPQGRQPGTRSRRSTTAPPPVDLSVIRQWARANGYQVSDRGPIAASVLAAYKARK